MASAQRKRVTGTVKWFNAKDGFGFITRHDNGEDIFVHQSCILKPNRRHIIKSVGEGEEVEFGVIASKVTGPGFKRVKGSKFVALRGGRKSRPGSRTNNGRSSKGSVGTENSEEDKPKELEKRTGALTIKSDTNAVESVKLEREVVCEECVEAKPAKNAADSERSDDKTSSDECGDAMSTESIKEDKIASDECGDVKSDTNAVKSERSEDKIASGECGDVKSAESIQEDKTSSDECGDAKSVVLIKEEKTSSDECEDAKSDTDEVESERSDDKTSSDECEDAQSAESSSTVTAEQ